MAWIEQNYQQINTLSERISLNRLFGVDETSSYVQFFLV